jgi:hypothetical protein
LHLELVDAATVRTWRTPLSLAANDHAAELLAAQAGEAGFLWGRDKRDDSPWKLENDEARDHRAHVKANVVCPSQVARRTSPPFIQRRGETIFGTLRPVAATGWSRSRLRVARRTQSWQASLLR